MKNFFKKLIIEFYEKPIFITILISFFISILFSIFIGISLGGINSSPSYGIFYTISSIIQWSIYGNIITLPIVLSLENLLFLILPPKWDNNSSAHKRVEIFGLALGLFFSFIIFSTEDIRLVDWNIQIISNESHSPIFLKAIPTLLLLYSISIIGYLYCRFRALKSQPPLATVLGIAAMYIGIALNITWCIQIGNKSILLLIVPINYIIINLKTIRYLIYEKSKIIEDTLADNDNVRFPKLNKLVSNSKHWPWLGLIAMLPLLGVIICILILLGQKPDSIIKAWTETADWTFSKQIPPASLPYDGHYLCTVAAGGHKDVVKPLRDGNRHGHKILVNRQLCVANAFEQVIEEKTPKFHSFIRGAYDKYGYPIATKITSPLKADITYFLMKPLEWMFLIILYLVDTNPENRIAVQYPHKPLPTLK